MATPGLETPPQTARTPASRRLIDLSQVTEVGGGNDIIEVISLSDQADVTVTVPAGWQHQSQGVEIDPDGSLPT